VMQRMIAWARARQRAIDDARAETLGLVSNVSIAYYIEMNLGPEAVGGKPGVTNNVLPNVNPDFVSYSSYSATNAYATTDDVNTTNKAFFQVLDYVSSKLPSKTDGAVAELGLGRRIFIGEFGSIALSKSSDFEVVRFVSRVMHAAMTWGSPFVLYWEFYDNNTTSPIIPRSGTKGGLYHLFNQYYSEAQAFVDSFVVKHGGTLPSPAQFNAFSSAWFSTDQVPSCTFESGVKYPGNGYSYPADTKHDCCRICSENPSCKVGVFSAGRCYIRYSTAQKNKGNGVACVKR